MQITMQFKLLNATTMHNNAKKKFKNQKIRFKFFLNLIFFSIFLHHDFFPPCYMIWPQFNASNIGNVLDGQPYHCYQWWLAKWTAAVSNSKSRTVQQTTPRSKKHHRRP